MNIPNFPQGFKELYEFLFVSALIALSSIAGILRRHRGKKYWICTMFFVDLFCSLITGIIAYTLILGFTANEWLAVGGASYCGHLGPVGIDFISERIKAFTKLTDQNIGPK